MKLTNIDRLLVFGEGTNGSVLGLDELKAKFGFDVDGTNYYYGVNRTNVDRFKKTGAALGPGHIAFLQAFLTSLSAGSQDEKTLILGLEPNEADSPYEFLDANEALLRRLAAELAAWQTKARDADKRLNIVVRFASEMNDSGQVQGRQPNKFKPSFVQTRSIFSEIAPAVLFSFSPALRADLPEDLIEQYWPGDRCVDIIGGTWYIGSPAQRSASVSNMQSYFLHRRGVGKPFALSEVGGHAAKPSGGENDAVLKDMLHELEALQLQSVGFKYVTLFLQADWGTDATLAFLKTQEPRTLA